MLMRHAANGRVKPRGRDRWGPGSRARRLRGKPKHSREGFERGFDAAHAPMALTDADGAILRINTAMLAYLARRPKELSSPPPGVASLLTDVSEPEAMVYRALRAAETGIPFAEDVEGGSESALKAVSARRRPGGDVLWTFVVAPGATGPATRRVGDDPVFERAPVALAVLDRRGRVRRANAEAHRVLGPLAEAGVDFSSVLTGLGRPMRERISGALSDYGAQGANSGWELTQAEVSGRERFFRIELAPYASSADIDAALIASIMDATRLKTQEEQFVQSQKIQAVGQLAGGVAHDFNNLLTVINGQTEMMLQARDIGDPDYAALGEIHKNGLRAAELVRKLLAFSRRQMLRPRAIDMGEAIRDLSKLLDRLVGERVGVRLEVEDDLWPVNADPGQMEQTVVNLVVNSRDAMPDGGEVLLRVANRRLAEPISRDGAMVAPGEYVEIEVSDEGVGIDKETRGQMFEPFYTTKPVGEGTGLGLSTVYGVVKQTGGFIFCDSEVGEGTTFRILLPRHTGAVDASSEANRPHKDLTGSAAVLIVEDDESVRMLAARALRQRGFRVTEKEMPLDALKYLRDGENCVDVIVSDVIMPEMDGPTLVEEARAGRPDMGVVLMSGYAEDMFRDKEKIRDEDAFISKPFALKDLVGAVKNAALKAEIR